MAAHYHIYDLDAVPVSTLATLASGLPPYSRSKGKITGQRASEENLLLAIIADGVRHIAWMLSKDGEKGRNHPESLYLKLIQGEKENDIIGFASPEEFEAARNDILRRGGYIP